MIFNLFVVELRVLVTVHHLSSVNRCKPSGQTRMWRAQLCSAAAIVLLYNVCNVKSMVTLMPHLVWSECKTKKQSFPPHPHLTPRFTIHPRYHSLCVKPSFFYNQMWKCREWKRQLNPWWWPTKRRYFWQVLTELFRFVFVVVWLASNLNLCSTITHFAGSQDRWIKAVTAAVQESSGHGDVGTSEER